MSLKWLTRISFHHKSYGINERKQEKQQQRHDKGYRPTTENSKTKKKTAHRNLDLLATYIKAESYLHEI